MSDLAFRFSSMGLHTFTFEQKFKRVILFFEAVEQNQIFDTICQFFDIHDLLAFISTSKRLSKLKNSPYIEVKILREKIKALQQPKRQFLLMNPIPSYCDFLFQQKLEKSQVNQNSVIIPEKLKQYKANLQKVKKYKQNMQLKLKKQKQKEKYSYINQKLNQNQEVPQFKLYQKVKNSLVVDLQKNIQVNDNNRQVNLTNEVSSLPRVQNIPNGTDNVIQSNMSETTQEKPKQFKRGKSYVERFRDQYKKRKEFEQKQNILKLKWLHQQTHQQIKNQVHSMNNMNKNIPTITMRQGQKIFVREQTVLDKIKDKVGFIFRFKGA